MARSKRPSLYERLGGEEAVARLVDEFYARVLTDESLEPFFRSSSMENLKRMQRQFFAAALGGPVDYSGRSLAAAHDGRGIRVEHVHAFLHHLLDTLRAGELSEEEVLEVHTRIGEHLDEIIGESDR